MGMFDYIVDVPEVECPDCGEPVTGWQSKDDICDLQKIPYWQVDNFYTFCDNCKCWIEFNRKTDRQYLPLSAYEQTPCPELTKSLRDDE